MTRRGRMGWISVLIWGVAGIGGGVAGLWPSETRGAGPGALAVAVRSSSETEIRGRDETIRTHPREERPQTPSHDEHSAAGSLSRCQSCHGFEATRSHPVGLLVDRPLPAGLPLESGRITCATCHDASAGGHYDKSRRDGRMLRPALAHAADACVVCHSPEQSWQGVHPRERRAGPHAGVLGRAHAPHRSEKEIAGGSRWSSRACLSCHDGVTSAEADADVRRGRGVNVAMGIGLGQSHPVDVAYPAGGRAVSSSGERFALREPNGLDPRITLPAGQVRCDSCHSLYSPEPALLVMSNRGSALCLSCHVK